MKKVLFSIITILLLGLSINPVLGASKVTKDDTGASSWQANSTTETNLYGMTHSFIEGTASTSGANYNQQVNMFEMKTDGINSKLVTWGRQSNNQNLSRATLAQIARDYEEEHPGWIVVGGINADQFYTKKGNKRGEDGSYPYYQQTYYPFIMDGERRYPITPYGITTNFVGFTNDGSANSFVHASALAGYTLRILDESGNVLGKYNVENINAAPNDNQTSLWASYLGATTGTAVEQKPTSSINNIYIVENAELAYTNVTPEYGFSGETQTSFFGRGVISSVSSSATIGSGQFAVETKNADLIAALSEGKKIVVQYDYVDEAMNNVEAASGYHSIQRMNGMDVTSNAAYNTRQYNRSIFGRKADGTYVLFTVDFKNGDKKYGGQNFTQTNAMLKAYGVVEAYQDDGGGSVTAIRRTKTGNFEVTNFTSDGAPRSVLTGLFFVVRDPNISVDYNTITRSSVELTQSNTEHNIVKDLKVVYDGKEFLPENGRIKVTGLAEDTLHNLEVQYSIASVNDPDNFVKTSTTFAIQTLAFEYPQSNISITGKTNETIEVSYKPTSAENDVIKNIVIHISDYEYQMGEQYIYTIDDLIEDTEYQIYFEYDVYDKETGNLYHKVEDPFTIKTLAFEAPTISRFELFYVNENVFRFKYSYKDSDEVVKSAYIKMDDIEYSIDSKTGTKEIDGSFLAPGKHKFIFVIEYQGEDGFAYKITSEELEYEIPEPAKKGCKKKNVMEIVTLINVIAVSMFIFKKKK